MSRSASDGSGGALASAAVPATTAEVRPATFRAWLRSVFGRREGLVPLAVLACFAAADLTVRAIDDRLSGNFAHIEQIPTLIADAAGGKGPSLLLLGNSLTNNGLTPPGQLAGAPLRAAKVTPDATALWDWRCLVEHQVLDDPFTPLRRRRHRLPLAPAERPDGRRRVAARHVLLHLAGRRPTGRHRPHPRAGRGVRRRSPLAHLRDPRRASQWADGPPRSWLPSPYAGGQCAGRRAGRRRVRRAGAEPDLHVARRAGRSDCGTAGAAGRNGHAGQQAV